MRRSVPRAAPSRQALPAAIASRVLLLRDDVMVLDKPAGLSVHRGPRGGASLEDWLEPLRMGKRHLPQPAHRLDADTSGCLVLGRTKPALAALGRAFAEGRARKTYPAVYNAANEEAVDAFHEGRIGFLDIVDTVQEVLHAHSAPESLSLDALAEAERWAREQAQRVIASRAA